MPIMPQEWHYRQSIEYEMTNNRAMLDLASRYRETLLYNIYQMGRNSIEKGSKDNWTITPKRIAALEAAAAADGSGGWSRRTRRPWRAKRRRAAMWCPAAVGGRGRGGLPADLYENVLHDPKYARSARLHYPVRSARFRQRDRVHQRAAQERHHGDEGDGGVSA